MDNNEENLMPDLVKLIQDTVKRGIDTSLPCQVTKVISRTKVNVKPLIKIVDAQGKVHDRDIIEGVMVQTFGAGDTLISFPLTVGSLGWIDASDRDLGLFLQTYESEKPSTARMHSFSDARFIPDIMHNFTIAAEDETALVIQNRNGSVKIAVDDNGVRITDPTNDVTINGARITPSGDVITASGVSLDGHPHNQGNDSAGNSQVATDAPTPTP